MGYKSTDSCIAKAADNEMLFVLRSQDISSPRLVLEWIKENLETAPEDKLREAFECAINMKNWPNRKKAD
jgi:hypothetical protein